jgi:hypothetical protein
MLAGTLASHYRVESQLGAGGMGAVYEAFDTRLGRRVALNVLHEESLSDANMLARLEREARVLTTLNHPNIAAIHGLEQHENRAFLVLEYVPGETLADRLMGGAMNAREAESRDGQRFLMIKDRDLKLYARKVRVVLDWVADLTKIVADANASR